VEASLGSADTPSPTLSSGGSPRVRCQKGPCVVVKTQLVEMTDERNKLQRTLDTERKTAYENYCKGMHNAEHGAPAADAQRREGCLEQEQQQVRRNNKRYLNEAQGLRGERTVLRDELAQAGELAAAAQRTIARTDRREDLVLRARGREDRRQQAAVLSAQEDINSVRESSAAGVAEAEARAAAAEARAEEAEADAGAAREEALQEVEAAREAKAGQDLAEYNTMLKERQVARAKKKAADLVAHHAARTPVAASRSSDEWAELQHDARRKVAQVERGSIRGFLQQHSWRPVDLADVLAELGLLQGIFDTPAGWRIYFAKVKALHAHLELQDFGIRFGLYLHLEMRLPLAKIQLMVEAACKEFQPDINRYQKKPWLVNPHNAREVLYTPRIVPARTKLEPIVKKLAASMGVQASENGLLAFRSMDTVLQEILARDTGKLKMPPLLEFYDGRKLPIIVSRDATGKGSLQFTTAALRVPWVSKSCNTLHLIAFGNCGDDRSGTKRLLGPNVDAINDMVAAAAEGETTPVEVDGQRRHVLFDPYFTDDVSALRHGEHLACSGWCGCSRDAALRQIPTKPKTVAEMRALVNGDGAGSRCRELSCLEREILSHNPPKGEELPRPCIAPGCTFAHNPATAAKEYKELLAKEAELAADTSKKGKQRYTAWRMQHAWKGKIPHSNVPPALYGLPLFRHHFRKQILDALHLAELGLPKTPWKHAIKNNASDDALEKISDVLKGWKHGLDMRRKDDGRVREQKWFTGEKWRSLCAGKDGSPGGPIAIATIVMIIADDLQLRGVDHGNKDKEAAAAAVQQGAAVGGRGGGRGGTAAGGRGCGRGGRGGFADRVAARAAERAEAQGAIPTAVATPVATDDPAALEAQRAKVQHQPSATEAAANQESLEIIRKLYGSRARTIINALLAFDAYFAWYYPFKKSVPYGCGMEEKEQRALDNCRSAIDMQEMFERVAIYNHGSFLSHGAVFKVTRDILEVGDVWAHDLSALELQNAESKRCYECGGARAMQFRSVGTTHKKGVDGEYRLVATKGYGATAATSVLIKLLSQQTLRAGDGMYATPKSRAAERIFGEKGGGRCKLMKFEVQGMGGEVPGVYYPEQDTCLDAFVRMLAARACCPDPA